MTITALWRAGAEIQHVNELDEFDPNLPSDNTTGSMTVSSVKFKTGAFSFAGSSAPKPRGKTITSTTQIRSGVYLNHPGITASGQAVLFYIGSTINIWVQWNQTTGNLELYVNTTLQASVAATTGGFSTTDTWRHLGIACKADAAAGFVSFYIDGVQRLTFSGNTGTAITSVAFGGNNNAIGNGFSSTAYWDDFYIDDTVGEADAAPTAILLPFLLPNGAGTTTGWGVYGVASNYLAVDETGAPNDLTDFVFGTSSGLNDKYAVTNTTAGVTVPSGQSIAAVILAAWAQRTDAAKASTLKLGSLLSGTTVLGSAQTLPVGSFGIIQERQATKPGGGTWSEANVDSMEYVQETAGTF